MEYAVDKIVIVNLEHAYALSDNIKTEQPDEVSNTDEVMKTDEVVIKTEETNENDISSEEITIKTELPDDEHEQFKNPPCNYSFESVFVNPQVTDFSNVHSEPAVNPLLEQKPNLVIKGHMINEQQLSHTAKKELKRKKLIQDLNRENKELYKRNQILRHNFKEYQQNAQARITTLLDRNNVLQSELYEFHEMKKNYKLLEDQLCTLTTKMDQFMSNTLPKLTSEVVVRQLKSHIDIKDKQQQYIELRVQNLKESVEKLKQVTTVVNIKQVEELQAKVKEDQENQEKLLKDEMKAARHLRNLYKHSIMQQKNQQQHMDKLRQKLKLACASVTQMELERENLNRHITKLKTTILVAQNKMCDYCGM